MSQLEKAARALAEKRIHEPLTDEMWDTEVRHFYEMRAKSRIYAAAHSLLHDAFADARAVIASIEPDDATVEAALATYWDAEIASGPPSMRAALKAFLRALLAEGEGR